MRRLLSVAVCALCLIIFASCASEPEFFDSDAAWAEIEKTETVTQDVSVMSINLLYKDTGEYSIKTMRGPLVKQLLEKYSPDSFGTQECVKRWIEYILDNVDAYDYVGLGRDEDGGGEYCAIFYLKDKYRVVETDTFWLSETPAYASHGWDAADNRVCTWALLENIETGFTYLHINTHLDHIGATARREGMRLILEVMEDYSEYPTVFTGDFNSSEGSEVYNDVSAMYTDSKTIAETTMNMGTFHNYSGRDMTGASPIDFCFVDKTTTVYEYKVVTEQFDGQLTSDHYPVYVKTNMTYTH